jgi:hypothetical protein
VRFPLENWRWQPMSARNGQRTSCTPCRSRFVTGYRQGRHRYSELAGKEVAYAVESLLVLSSALHPGFQTSTVRPSLETLEYARTSMRTLLDG